MRKFLSRDKYNKSAESYKIDYQIFKKEGGGHLGQSITKILHCYFQYVDTYTGNPINKYM